MKKRTFYGMALVLALVGVIFLGTCEDPANNKKGGNNTFSTAPKVTLTAGNAELRVTWTISVPKADSYDVYCLEGNVSNANVLINSSKVKRFLNKTSGFSIPDLTNGTQYGVVVTAKKSGYTSINSLVKQEKPGGGGGEEPPDNSKSDFSMAPVLTLRPVIAGLEYVWTPAIPATEVSYDLYWKEGSFTEAAEVKSGTKIEGTSSDNVISGLSNNTVYSVVVTASKDGYNNINSGVVQGTPSAAVSFPAPSLSLLGGNGSIKYLWPAAYPEADSYDVYWRQGSFTAAEVKSGGTKITDAKSGGVITGLSGSIEYSVVVTGNRANYTSGDSPAKIKKAGMPPASKRGVGYNFTTSGYSSSSSSPEKRSTKNTALDMDLLMSGDNGISWFYGWAEKPNDTVIAAAIERGLDYAPMAWNTGYSAQDIAEIKQRMPNIKYLLAFNEPNFTAQSNLTPQQAAAAWPALVAVARQANLKIVSPAMNFSPDAPYQNPQKWLDEFFALIEISTVDAISMHSYASTPGALKSHVNGYKKYNKPIWVTEFSAWESATIDTWQKQATYMTQGLAYLELDPQVERYAWYLPKGHVEPNKHPNHNLLTDVGLYSTDLPELTPLGVVYTNMTRCDKSVWVAAGRQIDAAQFTNCNISNVIDTNSWVDVPQTGITEDDDKSAGVLEIHSFRPSMWVEYQINTPSAKTYTLTLRYKTMAMTGMTVTIDGGSNQTATLSSSSWGTTTVNLGNMSAGNHTIRLSVTAGNCALNWLKVE